MAIAKIENARSLAELESTFWALQGDLAESTRTLIEAAERRFDETCYRGEDKDKITAASDLVAVVGWCIRQGIDYRAMMRQKGSLYDIAKELLNPKSKAVNWGRVGKMVYDDLLTSASAKLPGLLTDKGELSENLKTLIHGYRMAHSPLEAPETEEDRNSEAAKRILIQLRQVDSGTKISESSHPELFKGLHKYYPDEIREYVRDENKTIRVTATVRGLVIQKKIEYEQKATDAFYAGRDRARQALLDAVNGALLNASPVTAAMAEAWAAGKVRIEQTAEQAVGGTESSQSQPESDNAPGYILGTDDLMAQSKEFYRLVGGKVTPIRFYWKSARASAFPNPGNRNHHKLNVGDKLDKTTLFHELAHFLESDSLLAAASRHFRDTRATTKRVKKLSDITGNPFYSAKEKALQDHWVSPYVGKIYEDGSTEVASMGMQHLARAEDIAKLAKEDPQMLAFTLALAVKPDTGSRAALENLEAIAIANGGVIEVPVELQDRKAVYDQLVHDLLSQTRWVRDKHYWKRVDKPSEYIVQLGRSRKYFSDGQQTTTKELAFQLHVRQKLAKHYGMAIGRDIFTAVPDNFKIGDTMTLEAL